MHNYSLFKSKNEQLNICWTHLVTTEIILRLCLMAFVMFVRIVVPGTKSLGWMHTLNPSCSDSRNRTISLITQSWSSALGKEALILVPQTFSGIKNWWSHKGHSSQLWADCCEVSHIFLGLSPVVEKWIVVHVFRRGLHECQIFYSFMYVTMSVVVMHPASAKGNKFVRKLCSLYFCHCCTVDSNRQLQICFHAFGSLCMPLIFACLHLSCQKVHSKHPFFTSCYCANFYWIFLNITVRMTHIYWFLGERIIISTWKLACSGLRFAQTSEIENWRWRFQLHLNCIIPYSFWFLSRKFFNRFSPFPFSPKAQDTEQNHWPHKDTGDGRENNVFLLWCLLRCVQHGNSWWFCNEFGEGYAPADCARKYKIPAGLHLSFWHLPQVLMDQGFEAWWHLPIQVAFDWEQICPWTHCPVEMHWETWQKPETQDSPWDLQSPSPSHFRAARDTQQVRCGVSVRRVQPGVFHRQSTVWLRNTAVSTHNKRKSHPWYKIVLCRHSLANIVPTLSCSCNLHKMGRVKQQETQFPETVWFWKKVTYIYTQFRHTSSILWGFSNSP